MIVGLPSWSEPFSWKSRQHFSNDVRPKWLYACRIVDFHCALIWLCAASIRAFLYMRRGASASSDYTVLPKIFHKPTESHTNSCVRRYFDFQKARSNCKRFDSRRNFVWITLSLHARSCEWCFPLFWKLQRVNFDYHDGYLWRWMVGAGFFFSALEILCCIHPNQINWCTFNTRFVALTYLHKHDGFD